MLWGHCQGPWGRDQDRRGVAKTVRAPPGDGEGVTVAVWVLPGSVGARPRAVEAWQRTGGTPRGCGQDLGVWPGAVGVQPRPWGCG